MYDRHGRLHQGTPRQVREAALDAWEHARHQHHTVLLVAPTNDLVRELNVAAQARRLVTRELDTYAHTAVTAAGYRLHVGDEIVTRRNHRILRTDRHLMIRNRDTWTITAIARNGALAATGPTGTVTLPADYVTADVELGYAQTSHGTQGRTVDHSILVLDGPTDVRGIYVPMTRGRLTNDAYIAVDDDHTTAAEVFAESVTRSWIDRPAHARRVELTGINPHQPGTLPPPRLADLLTQQHAAKATLTQLDIDLNRLPRQHRQALDDKAQAARALAGCQHDLQAAEATLAGHDRLFHRRGNEAVIETAKATLANGPTRLAEHQAGVADINSHLADLDWRLAAAQALDRRRPEIQTRVDDLTHQLDDDARIRTRRLAAQPPERVTRIIGRRPPGGPTRQQWDHLAARIDQHQTAFDTNTLTPARGDHKPGNASNAHAIEADIRTFTNQLARQRHTGRSIEGPSLGIER